MNSVMATSTLMIVLAAAALFDLKAQRIPNFLTLPGILLATAYHAASGGIDGVLFSAAGIALGIGLMVVPYMLGGMGAGDAKLMGAIGAFLGAKGVLNAFLFTAVVGGVYALVLLLVHRKHYRGYMKSFWERSIVFLSTRQYIPEPVDAKIKRPKLCYGLAIAVGTGIYIAATSHGHNLI